MPLFLDEADVMKAVDAVFSLAATLNDGNGTRVNVALYRTEVAAALVRLARGDCQEMPYVRPMPHREDYDARGLLTKEGLQRQVNRARRQSEAALASHGDPDITRTCARCGATREEILDNLVPVCDPLAVEGLRKAQAAEELRYRLMGLPSTAVEEYRAAYLQDWSSINRSKLEESKQAAYAELNERLKNRPVAMPSGEELRGLRVRSLRSGDAGGDGVALNSMAHSAERWAELDKIFEAGAPPTIQPPAAAAALAKPTFGEIRHDEKKFPPGTPLSQITEFEVWDGRRWVGPRDFADPICVETAQRAIDIYQYSTAEPAALTPPSPIEPHERPMSKSIIDEWTRRR